MKYAKLGNSDLNVSRICMGCMGFGDAGRGQHSVKSNILYKMCKYILYIILHLKFLDLR